MHLVVNIKIATVFDADKEGVLVRAAVANTAPIRIAYVHDWFVIEGRSQKDYIH